jgi:hypothetical protein
LYICASAIGVDLIGNLSTGNLKVNSACGSNAEVSTHNLLVSKVRRHP